MEVPCCPKCSKESYADMRPNDPIVAFYSEAISLRVCTSCGQIYCMSWIQWLLVIISNSILLGLLPVVLWDGCIAGIIGLAILALVEPMIFDVIQTRFSWKPVDAAYCESKWIAFRTAFIVVVATYIGRYLVMMLFT